MRNLGSIHFLKISFIIFVQTIPKELKAMDTHFSIPFEVRLASEMFRFPFLGKFFSKVKKNTKDKYVFLNYALFGIKEQILKNKSEFGEADVKDFSNVLKLLSFVVLAIGDNEDQQLIEIKSSVLDSIEQIEEIIKIINDKLSYKRLKSNLFIASSEAINSHLSKYDKAG